MWTPVYVGVGSNLNGPLSQVKRAVHSLASQPQFEFLSTATAVESAPVGLLDQPHFVNSVVAFLTQCSLTEVHNILKKIETDMGKTPPKERFGPRVIDLDVLIYGSQVSHDPTLLIPHPRLHERVFVLYPLNQLAPSLTVPGRGIVGRLLQALPLEAYEGFKDLKVSVA
jgi:2-amino-4-hydroxy-6-hydroxymethyldihydropteridine diphosphokinase